MRRAAGLLAALLAASACTRGAPRPGVVARVGAATITKEEFQEKLAEVAPDYQNYVLTPYGRRQFLDVVIREKMVLQAARADGVDRLPEFKDRMRQAREEAEDMLSQARDSLLVGLWMKKLRDDGTLTVGDDEVEAFYKRHPYEVTARHILLATAEEAESSAKELRLGKASFPRMARQRSLDADTAGQGGLLPPAVFGELIPELKVVFKMRTGKIGGPIRSKFGYHVVRKESQRRLSLKSAEVRIRAVLEKQKLDRHLTTLAASFPVEVIDEQFK